MQGPANQVRQKRRRLRNEGFAKGKCQSLLIYRPEEEHRGGGPATAGRGGGSVFEEGINFLSFRQQQKRGERPTSKKR